MVAELVATIVCTAAGSYATYELVTRNLSVRLDSVLQQFDQLATILKTQAVSLASTAKQDVEKQFTDLKETHVAAIAQNVKAEIQHTLSTSAVDTCSFCGKLVAAFEKTEDVVKCANCKKAGK
jgi:hypothetical protein